MEIKTRPDCQILRTTEVVWDKWSLLIIRNLLLDGPHRFQDFINALDTISPTTLSKRLKSLEESKLIQRTVLDGHPPRTRYELTDLGRRAKPMMKAIWDFGGEISDVVE
ncbi:MAG: helix-turn-helix transcriptional regulator [Acidiferrobacterales bacterium]|nr:helix-turn-helix transcriptional regulator [Acidiferrobacterales bacterium]